MLHSRANLHAFLQKGRKSVDLNLIKFRSLKSEHSRFDGSGTGIKRTPLSTYLCEETALYTLYRDRRHRGHTRHTQGGHRVRDKTNLGNQVRTPYASIFGEKTLYFLTQNVLMGIISKDLERP